MKEQSRKERKLGHEVRKEKESAIGVTRLRSRSDATTNIFGRFRYWVGTEDIDNTSPQETVFVELVVTLYTIGNSQDFIPKVCNEANALLQKFLLFETILVATAFLLVSSAQNELENAESQFDQVFRAVKMFTFMMPRLLDEKIEGNPSLEALNLYLELELPSKRVRKIKKMAGELADDEETTVTEEDKFRTKYFNIIDKLNQSMGNRSADQKNLYLLIEELESFVQDWPQIFSSLIEEYTRDADMESDSESDTSEEILQNEVRTCRMEDPCKECINCASLQYDKKYNLEGFFIMQCERDKLVALGNDMVIDNLREQSEEMRRFLVLQKLEISGTQSF
ncbi:hypothetical protein PR048_011583, partial [Dryococelus australis]